MTYVVQRFYGGYWCVQGLHCAHECSQHISVSLLQGAAAMIVGVGAGVVKMTSLLSRTVSTSSLSGLLAMDPAGSVTFAY